MQYLFGKGNQSFSGFAVRNCYGPENAEKRKPQKRDFESIIGLVQ
jgi:hypothetical protein